MENLKQNNDRIYKKGNVKGSDLKDSKVNSHCSKKEGKISPTSARIIDEIVVKHKTALEILANR